MSTPQFPVSAIKGAAGRFADLCSSYMESPWQFFAMGHLTCLGSLIADKVTLESEISPLFNSRSFLRR